MEELKRFNDKCVIIDNADVMIDKESREYIGLDLNNQYIIIGRHNDELAITPNQIARLVKTGNTLKLDYYVGWIYATYRR